MAKESREQQILDAAIRVFSGKGFGSATTAEIAAEANVAEGTIFRYFKTKKDILLRVFDRFVDIFAETIIIKPMHDIFDTSGGIPIEDILKILIKDRMKTLGAHFEIMTVVLSEVRYHPEIKEILRQKVVMKAVPVITDFVEEGIKSGVIRDTDPQIIARNLVGVMMILILQQQLFPGVVSAGKSIDEDLDIAVDIFLHGILN